MSDKATSSNISQQVAIYERVSTEAQSVEMQDLDLKQYCEQRRFGIYHIYIDHGVSGTRERRPGLDQLMTDARKRKFDTVLVWRFDRFARSTKHLVTSLEEFQHLGIAFVSFHENVDTNSPVGKVLFTIISAIAELERDIIAERIRGGLRRAKAMGKKIGRPSLRNPQQVEAVRQMRIEGKSYQAIAKALGVSKSAAHKWVQETALRIDGLDA